ncbi:MAG: hypothetical protein N2319_03215 [Candidatus Kapabacteria bacterium]|nr:hypothetical protein [Candidatus Kapabacteria bacterium]
MPKITFIFIIISYLTVNLFGQQCDSCKKEFDILFVIKEKPKISQTDLENSWQITQKLYDLGYTDYIDSVANRTSFVSHSLTRTFSDICIKAGGNLGVDYYLSYLLFTNGSAEEERSFALERLFVKFPEIVLEKIGNDYDLLNDLTWGFVNNRYYGAVNPFENDDYTTMTLYENGPKPILNKDNCKSIFFETNPSMRTKYNDYKYQIDYIINTAIENLNEKE